eukprot:TRINITY_DN6649_c0_g1_i1.p2 TRINITY_DN6649_c0_g1~~TRINITY_DN6649_c0_g1_i1.p2  ORF type:complete len:281 (-),score=-25.51 TRINITY_DN6649_c0_g1_i1:1236-2078(-)
MNVMPMPPTWLKQGNSSYVRLALNGLAERHHPIVTPRMCYRRGAEAMVHLMDLGHRAVTTPFVTSTPSSSVPEFTRLLRRVLVFAEAGADPQKGLAAHKCFTVGHNPLLAWRKSSMAGHWNFQPKVGFREVPIEADALRLLLRGGSDAGGGREHAAARELGPCDLRELQLPLERQELLLVLLALLLLLLQILFLLLQRLLLLLQNTRHDRGLANVVSLIVSHAAASGKPVRRASHVAVVSIGVHVARILPRTALRGLRDALHQRASSRAATCCDRTAGKR